MLHAAVVVVNRRTLRRAIGSTDVFCGGVTALAVCVIGLADGGFAPKAQRESLLAFALLAAGALVARTRVPLRRRELAMLAALAAFAAWIAMSKWWSSLPAAALPESERSLVYVAAVAAVLVGVGTRAVPYVLAGAVAGVTATSAYGLGDYLFSRPPLDRFEGRLLFRPLGYANAFGIYAALGIVLSVGLALWARTRLERAIALAPLAILVPTLYLTSSRGAWVALPVGIAVTLYVGRRLRSRVAFGALVIAGVTAGLFLGSGRGQAISLLGPNRPHYWRVAWQDYEEHPRLGSGAGTYGNYWINHRPTPEFVHDAHSLYVESLAELGPIGLALVVLALGLPLACRWDRRGPAVAVAAGGYVAFLVHAGIDWDWEVPAVTVPGLLCGAVLLVATRDPRTPGSSFRLRAALFGAVLALAVLALIRLRGGVGLHS